MQFDWLRSRSVGAYKCSHIINSHIRIISVIIWIHSYLKSPLGSLAFYVLVRWLEVILYPVVEYLLHGELRFLAFGFASHLKSEFYLHDINSFFLKFQNIVNQTWLYFEVITYSRFRLLSLSKTPSGKL